MRTKVAQWMYDVISEENNKNRKEPNVFALAVSILDRFISLDPTAILRDQFQLLGAACLLISSKLNESELGWGLTHQVQNASLHLRLVQSD